MVAKGIAEPLWLDVCPASGPTLSIGSQKYRCTFIHCDSPHQPVICVMEHGHRHAFVTRFSNRAVSALTTRLENPAPHALLGAVMLVLGLSKMNQGLQDEGV